MNVLNTMQIQIEHGNLILKSHLMRADKVKTIKQKKGPAFASPLTPCLKCLIKKIKLFV